MLQSDENWDPHAIAGLLKTFLRDLPGSLLTQNLHMKFLQVMGTWCIARESSELILLSEHTDIDDRIQELSRLVGRLPFENYSLLRALTAHLILVVQNASVNKMNVRECWDCLQPNPRNSRWCFQFNADGIQQRLQRRRSRG